MPRQPARKAIPKLSGYAFLAGALSDRPHHSLIVTQCIAAWSEVEVNFAILLGGLVASKGPAASALYLSLRNTSVRINGLEAAAKSELSGENYALLTGILKAYKTLSADRNDLAHGIYGVDSDTEDAILWIDPIDYSEWSTRGIRGLETTPQHLVDITFVYKAADLEKIYEEFCDLRNLVFNLHVLLSYPDLAERSKRAMQSSDLYRKILNA